MDGGVPAELRPQILKSSNVVLMTPDVAHAWLMSNLREREVSAFLSNLCLLVLDEAHAYEGVFGTNMAYFMRRLGVVAGKHRLICSTATLGAPETFISQLTGRNTVSFGLDADASSTPEKAILLARETAGKPFESMVGLMVALARAERGRFLAFADSGRMVEQVVSASYRQGQPVKETEEEAESSEDEEAAQGKPSLLPYRAGYEVEDRRAIQKALAQGQLAGVVSTSAMELGIDIGEIDLVVMLNLPPSVKAFWQRFGRGGRKNPGVCLLIDNRGTVTDAKRGLEWYLKRPLEASWLYLENRYIQYSNALCAATELGGVGKEPGAAFASLPPSFQQMLENELNPTEIVASDLYPLKQRAQGGPHREFPIRSGIEQDFRVQTTMGLRLGNLMMSQVLREAYPGAVYYYMARPYRIYRFRYRDGEIGAKPEKRWSTRPIAQTMVFPRFQGGTKNLYRSDRGFIAESELQVSERVLGFTEQRGSLKMDHRYGPESPYYQREITRFFETTGVCWYFPEKQATAEAVALLVRDAFCLDFGIQERDLGVGTFFSRESPLGSDRCQGACVFDSVNGSLRLSQRLAEKFPEVVSSALALARSQGEVEALAALELLGTFAAEVQPVAPESPPGLPPADQEWTTVIARGEKAVYYADGGTQEVKVLSYRYTPQGLMYELEPEKEGVKWMVTASAVQPLYGETRLLKVNLMTGEEQDG
jgi:DEAD/DEAH box helicase domain-containing protein